MKFLEELASDKFDVMILNYANCDMVGHTGVMDAAVKAFDMFLGTDIEGKKKLFSESHDVTYVSDD